MLMVECPSGGGDDLGSASCRPSGEADRKRPHGGAALARLTVGLALAWVAVAGTARLPALAASDCEGLTEPERAIARLFEMAPGQRRTVTRCDAVLSAVARHRAQDMGRRRYFSHVSPEGDGPNRLVERAGYQLPTVYSRRRSANNVEVISAGDETAAEAWRGWLDSRSHRRQVLGLNRFFAAQTDYGVGHAEVSGSRYRHYWVLITATH